MNVLTSLPFERALEICLIIRQQSKPLDDPYKFIKAAITKNCIPDPISNTKKKSFIDLTQRDLEESGLNQQQTRKLPFYNWLEEE